MNNSIEFILCRFLSTKQMLNYHFKQVKSVDTVNIVEYYRQVDLTYSAYTNPFYYYEYLVSELVDIENVNIVRLCDLFNESAAGTRLIALRHDIDADPLTALRCARFLARKGVGGSFYLLHTALYYGQYSGGIFIRNSELRDWLHGFMLAGCEIGLHNDCLYLYHNLNIDGAKALADEINWLRSNGVSVCGTVAHNSGPVYGAENFEIFKGRILWPRTVKTSNGYKVPLGVLDESELGLSYEGACVSIKKALDKKQANIFFNDKESASVRSEVWMRRYLLDNPAMNHLTSYRCWLIGKDQWVVAGEGVFLWNINIFNLIDFIKKLPLGKRIVITVHPEYVRG